MRFSSVLLDLDGTLLNTIPDLADAVNAMRLEMSLPPLRQDVVATYVGKGSEVLVRRALADDSIEQQEPVEPSRLAQGLELFYQCYHVVNGNKTVIYEGVLDGLKSFREHGVKMAVVTNKPGQFTEPLLIRTGLACFFEHAVSGDTCSRKKPDPMPLQHACQLLDARPKNTLVIGDSLNDVHAARAAGMAVVVVPYGYNEGQGMQSLNADAIVSSIDEAAHWAKRH